MATPTTVNTRTNEHYSWAISPDTGDYLVSAGEPRASINLDVPIYIRLKAHRAGWLYAPNKKWGSDFYIARKHKTTAKASVSQNISLQALAPLLEDGRAVQIDIDTVSVSRHGEEIQVNYVDKAGENQLVLTRVA